MSSSHRKPVEVHLSLTEYAVLGLLSEGPRHGFAIAKVLAPGHELGRVLSVRRPLTYRALDRLVAEGLAEPTQTEPGRGGPKRTIHEITKTGRRSLELWLNRPVPHVRDMRIEFQLKLGLLIRAGKSPLALIRAQHRMLEPTVAAIIESPGEGPDHLDLWRRHHAAAAISYLHQLETVYQSWPSH